MTREITSALLIAAGIIIAAVLHALIVADTGRYQPINDTDILDTRTGERLGGMGDGSYISRKLKIRN